jgi:hypothetical protein
LNGKPGSGFFPVISGALLLAMSILAIIGEGKKDPPEFFLFHLHPLIAAIGMILLALIIGFFPALVLYAFGWLRWYEKYSWKTSILTTAIATISMYGIFAVWLRVPFPVGILFEGILG